MTEHLKDIAFMLTCWVIGVLAGVGILAILGLWRGWITI